MEDIEKNAVNTDRNSGTNTSALYWQTVVFKSTVEKELTDILRKYYETTDA